MSNEVKIFGELVDITKSDLISMEAGSIRELRAALYGKYPALASKTFVFAIGNSIVNEETKINAGDQIAVLPPFAGG